MSKDALVKYTVDSLISCVSLKLQIMVLVNQRRMPDVTLPKLNDCVSKVPNFRIWKGRKN